MNVLCRKRAHNCISYKPEFNVYNYLILDPTHVVDVRKVIDR